MPREFSRLAGPPSAATGDRVLGRLYGDVPRLPRPYLQREEHLHAIKAKVLDADAAGVGVVGAPRGTAVQGMPGVGKTILAAAVVEDPQIRAAFPDGIVWLTLGQSPDVLALQRRLLAWIAPDAEPPTEVQAGRDALDTALKARRWLIVLDDVWRTADLRAFEVADTPSRLLITTRDERIVRASGAVPHVVEELTGPAARAFLAEVVGLAEPDLPPAADEVIEECGRLPLALAVAGAMIARAPQDPRLWRDVVEALATGDHVQLSHEFDYRYPHALAAIQASVDFLPPEDRTAYLQLAVFPEDTPIPLAPLEKLWGIAGLALRNRVRLFADRTLARPQDDGTILLHDLQRDFVRHRCPDVPAAHDALLRGYRRDGAVAWAEIPDDGYLLDRLPYHLAGAGRRDKLRALLFNLRWLRRKLSARGVNALVADTALCPEDDEVERLGRTLRMSAHVLDSEKRQLTAQLLGRLSEEDGNRTARLLEAARREIPRDVLVPLGARHLVPPGALPQARQGHSNAVFGAAVLPDGEHALTWSADGTLRLWNVSKVRPLDLRMDGGPELVRQFERHDGAVSGVALLPDGARALSWSADGTLRLWKLWRDAEPRVFTGAGGWVIGAVVLPDGARALSWSADGTLQQWDLEKGRALRGHGEGVSRAVVLPDGQQALSWSGDTLRLWELPRESGPKLLRQFEGHYKSVVGAVVLAGGRCALSWSEDETLRLWNLENGRSRVLKGHRQEVNGAVVLADDRRALSWSMAGTLRLWDLRHCAERRRFDGHDQAVDGAVVLADGGRALSWSGGTLRVWDLESGRAFEGHEKNGAPFGFNEVVLAGGRHALSRIDGTLRLWDLPPPEEAADFLEEVACFLGDDQLTCCAVSDDGRLAVVGDELGRVLQLDLPV